MIGIILAAGNGSRLKHSTRENVCKPLLEINQKPLIWYSLENCLLLGIDRVCVVVGKEGEAIRQAVGSSYKGMPVHYVSQQEQKGLIHALMQALAMPENETAVLLQLSDEIFINLRSDQILQTIDEGQWDFICGVTPEADREKIKGNYSVQTAAGRLQKCTEKPSVVTNSIKGTGFCYFSASSIRLLKKTYDENQNTPCDLCAYMNLLIRENRQGIALTIAEKEFNINTAADIADAEQALLLLHN